MLQWIMLRAIKSYQFLSRLWPAKCRFYPSCSNYAHDAIKLHGVWSGGWLIIKRLAKCHPWHSGGVDHVPDSGGKIKQN